MPEICLTASILLDVKKMSAAPVIARLLPGKLLVMQDFFENPTYVRTRKVCLLEHIVEFPQQRNLYIFVELANPAIYMRRTGVGISPVR
jgi:hypothetical protein